MRDFFSRHWKLGWIVSLILLISLLIISLIFILGKKSVFTVAQTETIVFTNQPVVETITTKTQPEPTPIPTQNTPTPEISIEPTAEALEIGSTRISEIDGMEQVYVPAGEFIMGSTDVEAKLDLTGGRAYPEIPQFTYYLDSYWIDKYEVTNKQYHACMDAGGCTEPHRLFSYTYQDFFTNPIYDNYPVVWVNWFQANEYCKWAGRRLPTEAEWEKAARGTDGRKYTWGNDPYSEDKANICDINCTRAHALKQFNDGYADLAPVGSYPAGASPYGALDMAGNVWEWNSTEIRLYPYESSDGREDASLSNYDPYGPDIERVWRGSTWSNGLWWLRVTTRYHSKDSYSWYVLGIRCAATP